MTIIFTLTGPVPSKKNAWKRGARGNVYLPDGIQADIDALIWQAKSAKLKVDLKPIAGARVRVSAHFTVPREHKDLDNVFTTLLDVLQKAGILENDKLVRAFNVDETIAPGDPKVEIEIVPKLSTREHSPDARGKSKIKT